MTPKRGGASVVPPRAYRCFGAYPLTWAFLVGLVPLVCNPLTRWHFEPDKAALLWLAA